MTEVKNHLQDLIKFFHGYYGSGMNKEAMDDTEIMKDEHAELKTHEEIWENMNQLWYKTSGAHNST